MLNRKYTVTTYEKGDYVRSPSGVGIVLETEEITSVADIYHSETLVQHKSGLSSNPENKPKFIHRSMLISISKEEYDEEE